MTVLKLIPSPRAATGPGKKTLLQRRAYLLLAALLLPLAGCSAIDWAYNKAPSFIANEFEGAFDLTEEQVELLRPRLENFFAWHRRQELASYQALLDRLATDVEDGLSREEFLWLNRSLRAAWRRSAEKMIDEAGDLATMLTPRQIEHFRDYFHERSEKHADYLEKSQQQRDIYRAEVNLDRLEDWFGSFDETLEVKVLVRLEQLPDLYTPWLEYRQELHDNFIEVLRAGGDSATVRQNLKRVFLDESTSYALAFEPKRVAFWQAYADALVDISGWVSTAQRQKAIERLQKYARAASRLNRQS